MGCNRKGAILSDSCLAVVIHASLTFKAKLMQFVLCGNIPDDSPETTVGSECGGMYSDKGELLRALNWRTPESPLAHASFLLEIQGASFDLSSPKQSRHSFMPHHTLQSQPKATSCKYHQCIKSIWQKCMGSSSQKLLLNSGNLLDHKSGHLSAVLPYLGRHLANKAKLGKCNLVLGFLRLQNSGRINCHGFQSNRNECCYCFCTCEPDGIDLHAGLIWSMGLHWDQIQQVG